VACGVRSGTSYFHVAQKAPGFLRSPARKTKLRRNKKKKKYSSKGRNANR
jgi:hypothetical protein